jgi:hypothetical protein
LMAIARTLANGGTQVLSLDDIADAIGISSISPDEIDELFLWLESQGHSIGDPIGRGAADLLADVLTAARALRAELGRAPQPREIAERASLSLAAVQRGLWFARILQR